MTAFHSEHQEQFRVLVVDDDPTSRLLAEQWLGRKGFSVIEAEDGLDALKLFQESQPDIVLMDVNMPNMDGIEACRQIRDLPAGKAVPILMVTGSEDIESIEKCYQAGATDFTAKPINWLILYHRLQYMLQASTMFQDMLRTSAILQELRHSEARLDKAQQLAQLGSWEWDLKSGQTYWSEQLYRILGLRRCDVEPSFQAFLGCVPREERERVLDWYEEVQQSKQPSSFSHRLLGEQGRELTVQHQAEVYFDGEGQLVKSIGSVHDITQLKKAEEEAYRLAHYDSLTGLANRLIFSERVNSALELGRSQPSQLAVLFLDLDNFKRINDSLGHDIGDLLLQEVSSRLVASVRVHDQVSLPDSHQISRFGGDEFTLLLTEIRQAEDAQRVALRILDVLQAPMTLAGHEVFITPSIGIALSPHHGTDVDSLLKNADTAMYHAKKKGKNRFELFDDSMNELGRRRLRLENNLRRALEKQELSIHYQPQVCLRDNSIVGVEALLRWDNEELGRISPVEFIPVAEESGLITPIGEWALREACRQAKSWVEQGFAGIRVAVNLSIRQFVDQKLELLVEQILQQTGLDASCLELELTESMLMENAQQAIETLGSLKNMGVQLAIDDFGTGYSSLNYLRCFPVDRLKIDRSFVTHVNDNSDDAAVIRAILGMAHSLNLEVIAEGVETAQQREFLVKHHCDEIQGELYSVPVEAQAMTELLETQKLKKKGPLSFLKWY
ncbi:putative bifunctional diguanylate cyclase/phosphodiesterase [Dongshaea marina]|uniref:putative bifunctional diguanylate cyclase/phosphodiesterase n=1 Tax=Dongshaea marina TaxID=2047966 RepID=UPI000D3E5EB2|nr:EAL domain-containing protein [Dongshaea marina]